MSQHELASDLPYPVSVNRMYRAHKGRVIKSSEYRAWERECVDIASGALLEGFEMASPGFGRDRVAVEIQVMAPDNKQRDIDNILKCTLDAVESAGWIMNDAQVDLLIVRRMQTEPKDPRVNVTMMRMPGSLNPLKSLLSSIMNLIKV